MLKCVYIYLYILFIMITLFQTVTIGKGVMNPFCVGKYSLYINGWYACCAASYVIIICTITYIKLTLYPWIVRWLQEILRQYKLLTPITTSTIKLWQHMKALIYSTRKEIFIQHIICCMEHVKKVNNCFLILQCKFKVQCSWQNFNHNI